MIKSSIDTILKEINNVVSEIQLKKQNIEKLKKINAKKKSMNYNKYLSRVNELEKTEQSIKSLMENKYFKYIKHIDFTSELDVSSLNGFSLNKELGCILKTEKDRQIIYPINTIVSSDERKITYIYDKDVKISNILCYSFYSKDNGIPLIPTSIKVTYKDNEDNFYEPHFRFYNRNNINSFVNIFPFQPKKISKLVFEFKENVNVNNAKCDLYSASYYVSDNDNSIIIEIENENNLSNFNFSRKSEESIVPLLYFYSEDNINFKEIEFNNSEEALINLENNSNFFIKIISDDKNINVLEEVIIKTTELYSEELESSFGVYKIPSNITTNLSNLKITFPLSTYSKLKEKFSKLNDVDIQEFITIDNDDIYTLNSEYIDYIVSVDEKVNKLKYIDDISVLEDNKKYFTVYVDTNNMKIYFSSFMQEFNFFLEIQYQSVSEQIDKSYYTPYLFSISLKG